MSSSLRRRGSFDRKTSARSASFISFGQSVEGLESRPLLAGGPLTVVITELGTSPLEQVTIVDNSAFDTNTTTGTINYSTPTPSPFADFSITNLQVNSNRTASPTPTFARLSQSGIVTRTTTSGSTNTLEIQAEDYSYLYPATETNLLSSANATIRYGVAGDYSQFQSIYNDTVYSPIVTLNYTGGNPQSLSGTAAPTPLLGVAPFNLANSFGITLAPSTPGGPSTSTNFQSTGTSQVPGTNASIAGNVYLDNDLNGALDSGDSSIPGVTVTLTGTDANGNAINQTTTTSSNGTYKFPNLTTGIYTVTETQPSGYDQGQNTPGIPNDGFVSGDSISQVVITGGQLLVNYNFGETLPVSIGDFVWNDQDANGIQEPGEPGINGVTLTLTGITVYGAPVTDQTTTSGNGAYLFNEIPGAYAVSVDASNFTSAGALAAYTSSPTLQGGNTAIDSNPNPSGTSPSLLANAGSDLTLDFGYYVPVSINGADYEVSNNTTPGGLTSSTTGIPIPGTTVTLTGINAAGVPVALITTTNASGQYSFTGLSPSNSAGYTVTETPPLNDSHLGQTSTSTGAIPSSPASPVVSNIVVTNGGTSTENFFETPSVSLKGYDYLVSNTTTPGSLSTSTTGVPIAGTSVTLTGTDEFGNAVSLTTTTNASGFYSFPGLNPSSSAGYTVTETPPAADTHVGQTSTTAGAISSTSPVVSNIVLTTANSPSTDNFFETPALVALNGYDYLVPNTTTSASLTTSTTGLPIVGTTVKLTGTDEFGNAVSLTTTTNASGFYSFPGLNPSSSAGYTVTETPPAADTHVGQTSTTAGAISSTSPVVSNIVLTTANSPSTDNFFETLAVSLNGTDYLVPNTTLASSLTTSSTGLPISGTTVTLTGTDAFGNTVSKTTTTNASGFYSFPGLNPSSSTGYTVTETPPAADSHVGQTSTTIGAIATPAATPLVSSIVLTTNGATSTDNDFETVAVSINGTDYVVPGGTTLTTSTTGMPAAGTPIFLTGTDEFGNTVSKSTTTNASGQYSFPGLNPSNSVGYTVTETPPSSYTHVGQTSTTTSAVATPVTSPLVSSIVLATNGGTSTDNFFELGGSISGTVYVDATGNGLTTSNQPPAGSGDTPEAGVTVDLENTSGTVIATTVTASNGTYSFNGLVLGSYLVAEVVPSNQVQTGPYQSTSVCSSIIADAGFETPSVASGNYVYNFTGSPWTFTGQSGVSGNGSAFTSSNPNAPGGTDVAFLQSKGSFSQVVPGWSAGSYQLSFSAAQRAAYYLNNENFEVLVDGNVVATFNPSGSSYQTYTTPSFYVGSGSHTITFLGLDTAGGDNTAFIDNVCAMQYAVTEQPNGQAYYTNVLTAAAPTATNNNFSNYTFCNMSGLTNVYYSITTPSGSVTWGGLNIAAQGDTITAYFTIKAGSAPEMLSLVAYEAPSSSYNPSTAYQQVITSVVTGTYGPGTYSQSVTLPKSYYQVDFVCGAPLTQLELNGSNIDYEDEGRLNGGGNGGTQAYALSTLSGTVFADPNHDDKMDSGDKGLGGVTVYLYNSSGTTQLATTTTASNGTYTFSNLAPATYLITEYPPSGYTGENPNAGSIGGSVSYTSGTKTALISSIALNSNTAATGYNFGEIASSPQLAAGSASLAGEGLSEILGSTQLHTGTLAIAVDLPLGPETGAEQTAISHAISSLNSQIASLGISLVEVTGTSAASAPIHITLASSSGIGGVSQGVLGAYSADGDITLIQGWDWYFGTSASPITSNQYDFQTVVTHEIGHALGLGENSDTTSVMDLYLKPGQIRHNLTATDLGAIRQELGASQTSLATSKVSAVVPNPVLSSSLFYPRSQTQSQTLPLALSVEAGRPVELPSNRSVKVAAKLKTLSSVVTQPIAQSSASTSDPSVVGAVPPTDTLSLGSTLSLVNARQKASSQGMALDQVIDDLYGLGGSSIDLD